MVGGGSIEPPSPLQDDQVRFLDFA